MNGKRKLDRSESIGGARRPWSFVFVLAAICAGLAATTLYVLRESSPTERVVAEQYCMGCHNATDWDGGIAFESSGEALLVRAQGPAEREAAIFELAARKVRAGLMPPAKAPRPEPAVLDRFADALESRLDRAWKLNPYAGAEPLSRMNRAEYRNAVRDLLSFDAAHVIDTLPVDEAVAGFDNLGDGLSVSPTLIESYVSAAMTIAREAVGDRSAASTQVRYEAPAGLRQDAHVDGLPLGTRGGFVFAHNFPLDAVYEFRVSAVRRGAIAVQTLCAPPAIVLALDGRLVDIDTGAAFRTAVPAGPHEIAAAVADDAQCAGVNELYDDFAIAGGVRNVEIFGPFDATGPGDTPSRRAIFACYPNSADEETECARQILQALGTRAYRRPLGAQDPEVETLLDFYTRGHAVSGFEGGIEHAVARMLMSPQFIFQLEHEPTDLAPGTPYELNGVELATRLSFFIWSSLPDGELLRLAENGELGDPGELERQVARMLRDPRARALVDNFAGQWLSLRELREALPQDPEFDANLRAALEQETSLLFASIMNENRSVLDLLDSDTTFLNERLARHYGIAGVHGSYMREVDLGSDHPRRGLLGHGSWLTATSVADRTSPVIRGEWFVTHLLGAPVPAPPPGVEADLSDDAAIAREGDTLRERLERHRANPNCAACHQIMDPIGLALENFDLVGRWRESDNGRPVVTSTTLSDGTVIDGPGDLRRMLQGRSELFVTTLTEKLLTYALGRVVDDRDMPAVREIVRAAARDGHRFEDIVTGIVLSMPFRMRVKAGEPMDLQAESAQL